MYDEAKDRTPFDVTTIEEGISTLIDSRTRPSASATLRRLTPTSMRSTAEPTSEDLAKMDTQATPTSPPLAEPAPDYVNHPPHYTAHPSGVECITITEWMNFNLGNAVKYIWRSGDKGATIEDLKKARWYLDREIDRRGRL
jgi:Protein of unknwon function (DUF3310)